MKSMQIFVCKVCAADTTLSGFIRIEGLKPMKSRAHGQLLSALSPS